jgi:hypothetical protein
MKNLGMLCHCRLCRSKIPARFDCGCLTEADWHEHDYKFVVVEGINYPADRVVNTGGRNAEWIYLEEDEVAVFYSAKGNPMEIVPRDIPYKEVLENYELIASYEASVHGCWKLVRNQTLEIYKKKEK